MRRDGPLGRLSHTENERSLRGNRLKVESAPVVRSFKSSNALISLFQPVER